MKIVIDIDERLYNNITPTKEVIYRKQQIEDMFLAMSHAIRNGRVQNNGKWKPTGDMIVSHECDQCNCATTWGYPYCPYCGAKMEVKNAGRN